MDQYKKSLLFVALNVVFTLLAYSGFGQDISSHIHVDQFGYFENAEKVAVISDPQVGYNSNDSYNVGNQLEVRNFWTDDVVYAGTVTRWSNGNIHDQSGDAGWWFDFSDVTDAGSYYIIDTSTGQQTGRFEINVNPYFDVLQASFKAFYYNRCHHTKEQPFAEAAWTDSNNFLQDATARDAYDQNNAATEKDMTGGWFDAGDYNKYVTFAHDPIHQMLSAYEENPNLFGDDWNIPESGDGIPDIMNELKWELDWMRKMINADGSVHIKMGSVSYADNELAPPSLNLNGRYYAPTCSSASIAIASTFGRAARFCQGIEGLEGYGAIIANEAITCFDYFLERYESGNLELDCDDGLVKAGDADWDELTQITNAIVAAVYLYELTGDAAYSDFVAENIGETELIENEFIQINSAVSLDAMLHYTTLTGINQAAADNIRSTVQTAHSNDWGNYFRFDGTDLYRVGTPEWAYYWGSNRSVANVANLCQIVAKYNIAPASNDELRRKAGEMIHYFHGINPLGICYLSNMYSRGGDRCANQIYHTWFSEGSLWDDALNSTYGPAPGFLSGGPNQGYSGAPSPPANQPVMKAYLDFNNIPDVSWEITEPAIYYQAAYLRMLSGFVNNQIVLSNNNLQSTLIDIEVFPNPTSKVVNIKGDIANKRMMITNLMGQRMYAELLQDDITSVNVGDYPAGIYSVTIWNAAGDVVGEGKFVR